jgi:tRNA-2-methylthio-N6-dimethylallyladenosine synthase
MPTSMNILRDAGYGTAFSFKYSPRPGTPAAEKTDKMVDPDVASERLYRLQEQINIQQKALQDSMVGREVSVLFEKRGRLDGQLVGKSQHLHAVHAIAPEALIGEIARVKVVESGPNSLGGVLVG